MRMRFKPYARAELLAADFHIHDPFHLQGQWHAQFARPDQPLVLELGCGKGGFLSQLAAAHPENNYLGIDITDKVLILAKRKIEAAYAAAARPIDNVRIMSADIERIRNLFTPADTVSRIHINFCNPWSKNASSNKHRLTHPRQLIQYRRLPRRRGRGLLQDRRRRPVPGQPRLLPRRGVRDPVADRRPARPRAGLEHPHRARGDVHRDGDQDQSPHRPQAARRRVGHLGRAQAPRPARRGAGTRG